jgi:hypothetical protein
MKEISYISLFKVVSVGEVLAASYSTKEPQSKSNVQFTIYNVQFLEAVRNIADQVY